MKHLLRALIAMAAAVLVSCGGGSDSGSGSGTLRIAMTDAPACGFDHVYVTVDQVRVHQSANASGNDAGWRVLDLAVPERIDLLALTNGVLEQLGQIPLPAGSYQQIRLHLLPGGNSLVPSGGSEQPLSTPSATQSGYKVNGNFSVAADTLVDLVLDFDACRSIVQRGNGSYALKPVVNATVEVVSGSISGYLAADPNGPAVAGAVVMAQRDGVPVKSTVADTNGLFILSPLVRTSSGGEYDVVIVSAGYASAAINDVPVSANTDTVLSTSATPFVLPTATMHSVSGVVSPASEEARVDALKTSAGTSYLITSLNAVLDTGAYALSLPGGPLLTGAYSATLPITLSPDAASANLYTIRATGGSGASASIPVDVSGGDVSNANISL